LLYQLPNGKVIEISTEQFVEMSDEELEYLIAYNYGDVQENPWFGSVLVKQVREDFYEELPTDLTEVPEDDKINFLDIDYQADDE
jgi:hypothetical protein